MMRRSLGPDLLIIAKFLKNGNRNQLKKYLLTLLQGLSRRCNPENINVFPSNDDLTQLTKVVTVLGKKLGIIKTDFGDLFSAIKRIENRWKTVSVIDFADALTTRLCKVPISPRAVVNKAIEQCATSDQLQKGKLEQIDKFVDGQNGQVNFAEPWEEWYEVVKRLTFPHSFRISAESKELAHEFEKATSSHNRLLSFFFLIDLRRQQLEWNLNFKKQTEASLKWIYLLQRPNDYSRLKQIYFGNAVSPETADLYCKIANNRERRNRSYHKSVKTSDEKHT